MKTRARQRQFLSPLSAETERPLSPQHAFVVQFREGMDAMPGRCSGRVEHIVSGRAARFSSAEELWEFFTQILATIHD